MFFWELVNCVDFFGLVLFMADNVDISPFVDKQTVEKWPFLPHALQKEFLRYISCFYHNCPYHNPHCKELY